MIIDGLPAPDVDIDGPLVICSASLSTTLITWAALNWVVYSGTVHTGDKILCCQNDGSRASQVKQLFTLTTWAVSAASADEILRQIVGVTN